MTPETLAEASEILAKPVLGAFPRCLPTDPQAAAIRAIHADVIDMLVALRRGARRDEMVDRLRRALAAAETSPTHGGGWWEYHEGEPPRYVEPSATVETP